MSVTVIDSNNDSDFEHVANMFYNHFSPNDWDYVIIGEDETEVRNLAEKLYVCDYDLKLVVGSNHYEGIKWIAVTYHS